MTTPVPELPTGLRDATVHAGATLPDDESRRLAALRRYDVLALPPDGAYEDIVAVAARVFDAPVAIVSVVDADRIFFAARRGIDAHEVPRAPGLCASAITRQGPTVLTDTRLDPEAATNPLVAADAGFRFYCAAPLRTPDGHQLGTVCVLDYRPRDPSVEQVTVLEHLSRLVVHDLEMRLSSRTVISLGEELRAQAEAERRKAGELAVALQTVLLPPRLPRIPGAQVAARYRPANRETVGGDFYDVFPLGDRSWGILLGDVRGKGPAAAAVAAAARHALRAAATEHCSPAAALATLNETLRLSDGSADDAVFATVLYGRLVPRPDGVEVTVACGGHPLPLVVRGDGRIDDLGVAGTLLGVLAEVDLADDTTLLRPGDALVMFTDGLTDAKVGDAYLERDGVRRLLGTLPGLGPDDLVLALDPSGLPGATAQRDDLAVLAVRATEPCAPGARAHRAHRAHGPE